MWIYESFTSKEYCPTININIYFQLLTRSTARPAVSAVVNGQGAEAVS